MTGTSRWAGAALAHVAGLCEGSPLGRSLRVTLNFHPDREVDGVSVVEALARDGVYRSQFETRTSNGGLTAHRGGARWQWENRLFGGAYDDAPSVERPKYGALNHRHRSVGAAVRFGSAHLRLAEHVLDRTTFCFPDSVFEPTEFGTSAQFDLFGSVAEFDAIERDDAMEHQDGGMLDDYVEAQVHGALVLADDVEALVLDPCYRDSAVELASARLGVPVEWHEGRVLSIEELSRHPAFRGRRIVEVGRRVARGGCLDARIVGEAVRTGEDDPQDLKKVWHHVARFGVPPHRGGSAAGEPITPTRRGGPRRRS